MADKCVACLERGSVPHFSGLVPGPRDKESLRRVRREADGGDPLVVALEGVFALAEDVPQLDGLVARARDDLAVIGREGDAHDVLGVPDKAADGLAGVEVPEAHGPVPAAGEGKASVVGEGDVLNKVGVTVERAERNTIALEFGIEVPDHDGLVAGARDKGVGFLGRHGEASNCTAVTSKSSTKFKGCHFCYCLLLGLMYFN